VVLNLSGDIGGFGVGSDFAWQGLVTFRWQLTERTGALAAYRYMDVDYESGNGSNRFEYDMAFSGPALGSCSRSDGPRGIVPRPNPAQRRRPCGDPRSGP